MVGSGPAQQAMLSEGSDPVNPPKQTFELNSKKKLQVKELVNECTNNFNTKAILSEETLDELKLRVK